MSKSVELLKEVVRTFQPHVGGMFLVTNPEAKLLKDIIKYLETPEEEASEMPDLSPQQMMLHRLSLSMSPTEDHAEFLKEIFRQYETQFGDTRLVLKRLEAEPEPETKGMTMIDDTAPALRSGDIAQFTLPNSHAVLKENAVIIVPTLDAVENVAQITLDARVKEFQPRAIFNLISMIDDVLPESEA